MKKVSVGDLPEDWGSISLSERRDRISHGMGIPEGGSTIVSFEGISRVVLGRSCIRHSLKEYKSIRKDALMMNAKACLQTIKNASFVRYEPNTKAHVDKTMRYKSKCLIDGKEYIAGFIVHHNIKDNSFYLYHISLYDK